jgi:serine/threonine-protein kinase
MSVPVPAPVPPPVSIPPRASIPSYPQQRSGGRTVLLLVAVLLVAGFAAALFMVLMPRKGSLVVTVAGPGNKAIDSVQILVNDSKKCDTSPCRVSNLESGTHMVKIVAAGYQQTAAQAVKVQGGEDAVLNVTLAAASGTGVRVTADGPGLRLIVDGKDVGPLPQDLKDLSPGDHKFRIEGGDRYEPWEKTVTVEADKMVTLEPKLKVLKGIATIKAGQNADGARVLLVSGTERRPIPALPIKIDITTNKSYTLVAQRAGYGDFRQDITFEDGNAEKTFVIDMTAGETAPEPPSAPRGGPIVRAPGPAPGPRPTPLPIPAPAPPEAAPTGQGTININSIPPSNAILDGKPLGGTPKTGLKVSAGPHTVVFVHPEHGRKVRSVNVRPGETATAAVRFP